MYKFDTQLDFPRTYFDEGMKNKPVFVHGSLNEGEGSVQLTSYFNCIR